MHNGDIERAHGPENEDFAGLESRVQQIESLRNECAASQPLLGHMLDIALQEARDDLRSRKRNAELDATFRATAMGRQNGLTLRSNETDREAVPALMRLSDRLRVKLRLVKSEPAEIRA